LDLDLKNLIPLSSDMWRGRAGVAMELKCWNRLLHDSESFFGPGSRIGVKNL